MLRIMIPTITKRTEGTANSGNLWPHRFLNILHTQTGYVLDTLHRQLFEIVEIRRSTTHVAAFVGYLFPSMGNNKFENSVSEYADGPPSPVETPIPGQLRQHTSNTRSRKPPPPPPTPTYSCIAIGLPTSTAWNRVDIKCACVYGGAHGLVCLC